MSACTIIGLIGFIAAVGLTPEPPERVEEQERFGMWHCYECGGDDFDFTGPTDTELQKWRCERCGTEYDGSEPHPVPVRDVVWADRHDAALATALLQLEEAETTIRFADKRFEIAEARCSSLEAAIREAEGLLDDIQGNLMSGDREVIAEIEATLRAALADSDQEERA